MGQGSMEELALLVDAEISSVFLTDLGSFIVRGSITPHMTPNHNLGGENACGTLHDSVQFLM